MMCKTVANKLFFVVAITPVFLGGRAFSQAFIHDKLIKAI
jgi:hypothetical protein